MIAVLLKHLKKVCLTLCLSVLALKTWPCTDVQIQAQDGTTIVGRTMDFDRPMHSALAIYPRGEQRTSLKPNGQAGLSWTSRYAYAGMNEFGNQQMISDGINEQGLALEDLWLAETTYNSVTNDASAVLLLYDLPAWILGNFANVNDVKKNLPAIRVWANNIAVLNSIPPLHFAIHDASGANIVVEFLQGQTIIVDNPVGVLTNSPPFAWQLTNLRNYEGLSNRNHPPAQWGALTLSQTGPGSGLIGLPGDYSPVSRFVRAATLVHFAGKVAHGQQAQNRMMHLINAFDVPYDAIFDPHAQYPGGDYTQWSIVKNLATRTLLIRPNEGMGFYQVNLAAILPSCKNFHRVNLTKLVQQNTTNATPLFQCA